MTCAYAVRVAIQKLPGIESVVIGLNRGRGQIELKPGNKLRIEQIWEKISGNGNSPRETRVIVEGKVVSNGGKFQLEVVNSGRAYDLVPESSAAGILAKLESKVGQRIVLGGR
jgi:hypothetical protein